ncbi:putative protein kinase [Leptomonas pyrrhocoris]|uniref:Protein kinase domain-containing protein n=1 Tax=Leptomonas pyrrhocoris TaxID=157538 RepID=A0A0M9FPX9_LEPPY|nr:putative protein kinase [Leptomonas pyrrhocoris]KPA73607.1 putative protein kinase [Leptomonas pyrrhocoris]|eukprot:XP_015652046.1 putative protein kinase [Leptomonas pyrrhocoris]
MLQEENSAFSEEEEVGGARAQPLPPIITTPAAAAAAAAGVVTNVTAAVVMPAVSSSSASPSSSSQQQQQQQQNSKTDIEKEEAAVSDNQPIRRARSGTGSADDTRESAFAVAAAVMQQEENDYGDGGATSFFIRAADPADAPAGTDAFADPEHRSACVRGHNDDSNCKQQQAEGFRPLGSIGASSAAMREAALDEELLDNDDGVVRMVRSISSHSRSGLHSRGPPLASVMEIPPSATTPAATALAPAAALTTSSFDAQEEALWSRGLARPASQESISFTIRSSSSTSSVSSRSSKARGEIVVEGHRASPVTAVDAASAAAAARHANVIANEQQQQSQASLSRADDGDNNSTGPLPSANDDRANRRLSASGSLHSSPAAVTLWGVHRDLRRKRIKKVSHYILGSLLGEGAYGVVRDCIDINTDNVNRRFQRCAIKIVNGRYAKADMPAIFGHRHNSSNNYNKDNNNSSQDGDDPFSLNADVMSPLSTPLRGGLKRTSGNGVGTDGSSGGMRYHREEEQKHQDMFQREMRNLQRFHCKNIMRALDSFTRYSKEYVVLPIAICSVQQLVRQLMRTRWREAVREWRRRQRRAQRKHEQMASVAGAGVSGAAENGTQDVLSSSSSQQQQRGLPMVLSTVDTLDFDDLTFMMADASDFDDESATSSDDDDGEDVTTAASANPNSATAVHTNARGHAISIRSNGNNNDDGDDRHNSGSFSDRDEDRHHHHRSESNRGLAGRRGTQTNSTANAGGDSGTHRRGLPRVSSTASNSTTTTTTRTIDSYENENGDGSEVRGVPRPQQRGGGGGGVGGEEESSDLSSRGARYKNNSNASVGGNNVHVMSATPTGHDCGLFPSPLRESGVCPPSGDGGGGGHRAEKSSSNVAAASSTTVVVPTITVAKNGTAVSQNAPRVVDDSRPHLAYPMCSTTLLKGIFYQVICGVNYLHQQGLAHNDIKPSNILLFEDGSVKLGDLGSVSEAYNDQGTPLYASPELCKYFYGAVTPPTSFSQSTEAVGRDAAQPSDMWCCGLLLYYLITGKPGPLPVQIRYFQSLHSVQCHTRSDDVHHAAEEEPSRGSAAGAAGTEPASVYAHASPPPPTPPVVTTRYQLYREIASRTAPVELRGLPDMIPPDVGGGDDADGGAGTAAADDGNNDSESNKPSSAALYPSNSVRHLLAGLLELDPRRRLTAEQALRHPWLRMAFCVKSSDKGGDECSGNGSHNPKMTSGSSKRSHKSSSPDLHGAEDSNGLLQCKKDSNTSGAAHTTARKTPSKQAMEDAIQRDVARRVTESRHVQRMLMLDRQRHLQFVADCCNTLNLNIPPEIIRVQPAEPYREDFGVPAAHLAHARVGASLSSHPSAQQQQQQQQRGGVTAAAAAVAAAIAGGGGGRQSARGNGTGRSSTNSSVNHSTSGTADAVTGTVVQGAMMPAVMPPGCVDTELFLPHTEEDYYEQKSGKSEFDVRVLRRRPLLMAQLDEYFHNVVLVQCGYRTGPDPYYQAMRVRAVPLEDEAGSSVGGRRRRNRVNTQQPSVVILPGASSNAYRRSPSASVAQITSDVLSVDGGLAGDTADVLVEDVWGAGPRHQPRVYVDENGNVVSAATHYAAPTVTADVATAAGRVGGDENRRSATAGNGRDSSRAAAAAASSSSALPSSSNPSLRRSVTPLSAQAAAAATSGPSSANNNNNSITRSSGAGRPVVAASANSNNRRGSHERVDAQEVMGTAVVNTARASVMHSGGNRSAGRHGSGSGNNRNRSSRDASDSASEAEQNVAVRESSKCLCGLM